MSQNDTIADFWLAQGYTPINGIIGHVNELRDMVGILQAYRRKGIKASYVFNGVTLLSDVHTDIDFVYLAVTGYEYSKFNELANQQIQQIKEEIKRKKLWGESKEG